MRFVSKLQADLKGKRAKTLIRKTYETTDDGDDLRYLEGEEPRPFKVRRTAAYVEVGLEDIDSTIEKVIETLEYLKKELEQRKHSASK
jgi:hypothetical protein